MFRYDVGVPIRVLNAIGSNDLGEFDRLLGAQEATVQKQEFIFALIHGMNAAHCDYIELRKSKGEVLDDPTRLEMTEIITWKPSELQDNFAKCLEVLKEEIGQLPEGEADAEKKN